MTTISLSKCSVRLSQREGGKQRPLIQIGRKNLINCKLVSLIKSVIEKTVFNESTFLARTTSFYQLLGISGSSIQKTLNATR